ncbi:hypothetical protein DFP72DRAFT_1074547 [Ephemerocybe angulata]|uniref:Uncharacterized protein n=1 Tax=Ephemerocybe angulata TaxID=980116 RepID=A0A8H6HJN9_9AGAR|nr:hypothetical protein DFP72DRAFT_1074547 [Tulosesus angulatus]
MRRKWWKRLGGGVGGATAPLASVTVVFAEGTGPLPSLSAEESVGMLARLPVSPSSSSSASAPPRYLYRRRTRGPQLLFSGPAAERTPSLSTSPSKTASWFVSLGRSEARSASPTFSTS